MSVAVNQLPPLPRLTGSRARARVLAAQRRAAACCGRAGAWSCRDAGLAGWISAPRAMRALPRLRSACVRCALPLPMPGTCGACRRKPSPLGEVHAACLYAAPVDRLLPRFKFHDDLAAGRVLSQLMAEAFRTACRRPMRCVPIPLHARALALARLRPGAGTRAAAVARARHPAAGARVGAHARDGAAIASATRSARRRNVRRAFAVRPRRAGARARGARRRRDDHRRHAACRGRCVAARARCASMPGCARACHDAGCDQCVFCQVAIAMPANMLAPTHWLCRNARKHASRSRWRAIANS